MLSWLIFGRPTLRGGPTVKVAVTLLAPFICTVQVVPEQSPEKPENEESEPPVACSATLVPLAKLCVQTAPQRIPAGVLVTVPSPVPALVTVSGNGPPGPPLANVAVTFRDWSIVTAHT